VNSVSKPAKYTNPFYVILVVAGIAFCITACAFGVMTVRGLSPDRVGEVDSVHPLVTAIDRYGVTALMIELGVLGVCTVAAIATDEFWERRGGAVKMHDGVELTPAESIRETAVADDVAPSDD
jgi:hypothetical protein